LTLLVAILLYFGFAILVGKLLAFASRNDSFGVAPEQYSTVHGVEPAEHFPRREAATRTERPSGVEDEESRPVEIAHRV
jgi:hypothetical protein